MEVNQEKVVSVFDFMRKHWGEIYTAFDIGAQVLGKKSSNSSGGSNTDAGVKKVVAPLGIAAFTPENDRQFRRILIGLDDDSKVNITSFLLEYYIAPMEFGFISKRIARFQFDEFMLEIVNQSQRGTKVGDKTTTETDVFSGDGKRTRKETKFTEEITTQAGNGSVELLKELGEVYAVGGIPAADEFLKLHSLPRVNSKALKKTSGLISKAKNKLEAFADEQKKSIDKAHRKMKKKHKGENPFRKFIRKIQ